MQSEFYKAGYDETMEKLAGPFGAVGGMIGRGVARAGEWLGSFAPKMGPFAKGQAPGWLAGKAQSAAGGLGKSLSNLASAPGQTLWQGAGNFGKGMVGMGNAATTSGVLGRGAMVGAGGYGLSRAFTGGPSNNMPNQPGNNMPT